MFGLDTGYIDYNEIEACMYTCEPLGTQKSSLYRNKCWAPGESSTAKSDKRLRLTTEDRKLKKRKRQVARAARRINRR